MKMDYQELPNDHQVEQVFLGTCLMSNKLMDAVVDFLEPEHFAHKFHQDIYKEFRGRFSRDDGFNPVNLKAKFLNHPDLPDDQTSGQYLSYLASVSILPKTAVGYGRAIHDLYLRRCVIETSFASQSSAYDVSEGSGLEIIQEVQNELSNLSLAVDDDKELVHISAGAEKALRAVEAAVNKEINGITTGIASLDAALGGLKRGALIILAGRPAMGKSALAVSIMKGSALDGFNSALFSLEMEADELTLRMATDFTHDDPNAVSYFKAGNGDLNDMELDTIRSGLKRVGSLPAHISDRGGVTVDSIKMESRKLIRKQGKPLDLIIVDYLQLMNEGYGFKGNRVQEISNITRKLKQLAKELNVPIVALSQLSRNLEQRENKRPILSDLRESGSIEQDADVVAFVYRHHYYIKNDEPKNVSAQADWHEELLRLENLMEIIIAKQRRGPTKTLRVESLLETNTIRDFS